MFHEPQTLNHQLSIQSMLNVCTQFCLCVYVCVYIILLRIQQWRDSHPTLGAKRYRFGATLTTAVSGVYNAGWLSTGLGSRVFNRDTNVPLDLTSWGNRTPVTDWFCQMPSVFCQSVTILVLYTNRANCFSARHDLTQCGNFIRISQIYWGTSGNTTQAKYSRQCYYQSIARS